MRIRYAVLLALFALIAGLIAGFFAFSFYWRHYNSSLISQNYSNLERYSAALSACERTPGECNEKFVALLQTGYLESLVLVTGIYVISQDDSYQFAACSAIKKANSSSPDIIAVEADAKKHLQCENGI